MRIIPFFILAAVVLFGLLGLAGEMDYQDALREERNYCKMVREGSWPDYENIYEEVCKKYESGVDNEFSSN